MSGSSLQIRNSSLFGLVHVCAGTSPYLVPIEALGDEGLMLAVVAMHNKGSVALATTHLKQPYIPGI